MPGNTSEPFGSFLQHVRKRQRLTQQQLANALGVHRNTISRWEAGSFLPESKTVVLELARCLHLDEPKTRQLLDASLFAPIQLWSVPFSRNPFFTGREEVLEQLHTHLSPGLQLVVSQSYALHGLGGIGKTQLALEYAYRYALEYRAIFWIAAETMEQIHTSLLRIAEHIGLPEHTEANQQRIVEAVQRWLETHEEWLLIWDNLEELDLLQRWLSFGKLGTMVITTRSQVLGPLTYGIDLVPMGQEESLLFLLRRARLLEPGATSAQVQQFAVNQPDEYAAASELIMVMGGLPLALDQAGGYIEESGCCLADYLSRYEHQQRYLLDRRGLAGENHPQSVTATFVLTNKRIECEQRAAAALLQACTFLHAEAIPEELFTMGTAYLGSELESLATDPLQFDEAIALLRRYSLIQRHTSTHTFSFHRLVQVVLREQMSIQEQHIWQQRVVAALNALFPESAHEVWERCERFLPHVLACAAAISDCNANQEVLAEVLRKAADYLRGRAQYEQAEPLYQRALYLFERTLGSEHLSVARLLHNLAILYGVQGKYEQMEVLGKKALRIREQVLGPMHPDVAKSLNVLAVLYKDQGKYELVEPLHQRALFIREQALGPMHPDLAISLNNLGLFYTEQGKYEQAERLYQRAVFIREQVLGPMHPDLAGPLDGLAIVYSELRRDEQAKLLHQRALHIIEQTQGPEHPLTSYPLNGLARLYQRQGKDEQAEVLYQQALRIRRQAWGEYHPETAQTLHDLAIFRQKQGKVDQAVSLAEHALTIRLKTLGEAHPKTRASLTLAIQLVRKTE